MAQCMQVSGGLTPTAVSYGQNRDQYSPELHASGTCYDQTKTEGDTSCSRWIPAISADWSLPHRWSEYIWVMSSP
jgi:hypothetical protein